MQRTTSFVHEKDESVLTAHAECYIPIFRIAINFNIIWRVFAAVRIELAIQRSIRNVLDL